VSEQRAIAEFLDRETGKIDALVAKKERLIQLLQEKRTALITHAVTKGLNPDVPMKDSAVEWLGEIPAHWEAGALGRWWQVIDCKHRTVPFVDEGIPVASIGEVQDLEVDLSSAKRTTFEEYQQMVDGGRDPRPGDILYSRNATVGAAALVVTDERFCMGQDVSLIRSTYQDQRYLVFLLRSPAVMGQLDALMVGATFKRINVRQIKNLFIAVPPTAEQKSIAAYCTNVHVKVQALIDKNMEGINRLKEFRTALISAAVTGKIDIREEVHEPRNLRAPF
jgi:type I restriction enzyme S subunit